MYDFVLLQLCYMYFYTLHYHVTVSHHKHINISIGTLIFSVTEQFFSQSTSFRKSHWHGFIQCKGKCFPYYDTHFGWCIWKIIIYNFEFFIIKPNDCWWYFLSLPTLAMVIDVCHHTQRRLADVIALNNNGWFNCHLFCFYWLMLLPMFFVCGRCYGHCFLWLMLLP